MPVALLTGAPSGIGLAFAERFSAEKHDLILVARNLDRLERVAAKLSKTHGISVEVMSADLAQRDQVDLVADRLSKSDAPVEFLVNNAGFGIREGFVDGDLAAEHDLFSCRKLGAAVRGLPDPQHSLFLPWNSKYVSERFH